MSAHTEMMVDASSALLQSVEENYVDTSTGSTSGSNTHLGTMKTVSFTQEIAGQTATHTIPLIAFSTMQTSYPSVFNVTTSIPKLSVARKQDGTPIVLLTGADTSPDTTNSLRVELSGYAVRALTDVNFTSHETAST